MRPSFLRMTFQVSGPSTVTDRVVPKMPGWSVPSATIISGVPAPKSKAYLFAPAALTFISSGNRLLDGLSFHLPTKGSLAAHEAPGTRQATSSNWEARFNIKSSSNCDRVSLVLREPAAFDAGRVWQCSWANSAVPHADIHSYLKATIGSTLVARRAGM